jgi:hypothetical protein
VTAAIVDRLMSRKQIRVDQACHELRDRRPGNARAQREFRARRSLLGDRSQREELRDRQGRFMPSEQPLDPTADERRYGHQRFRSLGWRAARSRH